MLFALDFDVTKLGAEAKALLIQYGMNAVGALVLLFFAWIVAGWISGMVRRTMDKAKIDLTLTRFIEKLVRWLVLLLAFLAVLSIFGVETTSFAAVMGAAGLAIGLAFQGTLANFAAGVMLLVFRPFSVGDVVTVGGTTGKVDAIDIFSTTIDTFDNRHFVIPNGDVFGSVIENISYHGQRRADVDVGVSYDADIDETRSVLESAASSVELGLEEPAPAVILLGLGDSSVNWSVRVWANKDQFGDVKQATIRAVKNELDKAGLEIPYPHLDVNLRREDGHVTLG